MRREVFYSIPVSLLKRGPPSLQFKEKPVVLDFVEKFITVFTTARHLPLSRARLIQTAASQPIRISPYLHVRYKSAR
jgi:hypothetical protein